MKYAILLTTGAALALAACQESAESVPEAPDTAAAEATAAPAVAAAPAGPAVFTAGQPPSPEFMVGTWGEGDVCEMPITFAADGKIINGPFDSWTIENGELVMGGEVRIKLAVVDQDSMESQAEGSTEKRTLKRCG